MKKIIKGLILLFTYSIINITNASTIADTKISMLMLDQYHGDKVYIKTTIPHQLNNPSCHNSIWSFTLQLTSPLQEKMYSMLLAAQTAGKKVSLIGYGSCSIHTGIETLRRIEYK